MAEIEKKYEGSYSEILKIAIPLILCSSSLTIQLFVDRLFLSHYSDLAFSASMPAGLTAFTLTTFFHGVAGYVNTFIAQYEGAKQRENIGASLWQGLYFAFFSGIGIVAVFLPLADEIFKLIGHSDPLPQMEAAYFKIVIIGGIPAIISTSLSSFYSGLGKTYPLIWVNLVTTLVNVCINYLLIFGNFGFPEMGLIGAAIGTLIGEIVCMTILIFIIFNKTNIKKYGLLEKRAFNPELFKRLLKFGTPSGIQFMIDMTGFNLFVLLIGRLGTTELAATNAAFNINLFAFMPMIGFAMATTTLVGQYLGRDDPRNAERTVRRCFKMTMVYMFILSASYILFPDFYVKMYGSEKDIESFNEIRKVSVILLRFVAFYSLFDTLNLIYSSALRGAGDTFFIMVVVGISSIALVVIPTYITCVIYKSNIYVPWSFFTFYVAAIGIVFYLRYKHGKWKTMRVI